MNICAIIPARGGSKGVPKKNIRPLCGHPIIAFSIITALSCNEIDRIVVSTDNDEIAKIAKAYGAEVPFIRPSELSGDESPAIDYIAHAFKQLELLENYKPDIMVMLLPTTPIREIHLVEQAINLLKNTPDATGLRSVHELPEPPQKMMAIEDGYLTGFFPEDPRPEYFNLPRQLFPKAYHPNGYVELVRRNTLLKEGSLYGPKILGFITPFSIEIDTPEDFNYLDYYADHHPQSLIKTLNYANKILGQK